MWDLPRPGIEPTSPTLAGRFSATVPPGKSSVHRYYHGFQLFDPRMPTHPSSPGCTPPSWRRITQACGERPHVHCIARGHCQSAHCCPEGSQAPNAASQLLSKHPTAESRPPVNTSAGRGGDSRPLTAQLLALQKPGFWRLDGTFTL